MQKTSALVPTKIGNATRHYRKLAKRFPSQHVIGNGTAKFEIMVFALKLNDKVSDSKKIFTKCYLNLKYSNPSNVKLINDLVALSKIHFK